MNLLKQFSRILLVSLLGEILKALLPLPIPEEGERRGFR